MIVTTNPAQTYKLPTVVVKTAAPSPECLKALRNAEIASGAPLTAETRAKIIAKFAAK